MNKNFYLPFRPLKATGDLPSAFKPSKLSILNKNCSKWNIIQLGLVALVQRSKQQRLNEFKTILLTLKSDIIQPNCRTIKLCTDTFFWTISRKKYWSCWRTLKSTCFNSWQILEHNISLYGSVHVKVTFRLSLAHPSGENSKFFL